MKQFYRWIAALALCASPALAQPTLEFEAPSATARPGQPYAISVRVVWDGDADSVTVLPPEVGEVDWGAVRLGASTTSGEDGHYVVTHTIEIVPSEAGEFTAPVITVPYSEDKMDALGGAEPLGIPRLLQTETFSVIVRPDRTGLYLAGAVLAIAIVLLLVVLWRRRVARNAVDAQLDARTPQERAQATLHDARRRRLDGNYYLYYVVLTQAAEILRDAGGSPALVEKLAAQAQAVGYQGVRPTDDDMDSALRELERALAQSKETSTT